MMQIREEQPDDYGDIQYLLDAAFDGPDESALVQRLRDDGQIITALVAVEYGEIVGHIVFSALEIASNDGKCQIRGASLAPMAVAPTHQRLGIGSELVRQGLEICEQNGIEAIVVVGHKEYYPRFGFSAQMAENLKSAYSGPFCMALDLKRGIFDDFVGTLIYPDAFALLSEE